MADHDSLEMATDRIGRQLSSPSLAGALVERRLMARMMSHPSSRLQAFRFVDVLPPLSNHDAIVVHLTEYLGEVEWPPLVARIVERSVARWHPVRFAGWWPVHRAPARDREHSASGFYSRRPWAFWSLVLKEEFLGVEHGPADVFECESSVLAVADVLVGGGHFGVGGFAGQGGEVE